MKRARQFRPQGQPTERERKADQSSARDAKCEWRSWYYSRQWQSLRLAVLERDCYTCSQTGEMLIGKHPAPNSPVVDHIEPHHGNPDLFWDMDNLQAVSKAYHDVTKQVIEKSGKVAAIYPKWIEPSLVPVTLVCGPPGSGKSSLVDALKGEREVVIDLDVIASRMAGSGLHAWRRDEWLNEAMLRRNRMLSDLSRPGFHLGAWFVSSEPQAERRQFWVDRLGVGKVIVLAVAGDVCRANIANDNDRDAEATGKVIDAWWVRHRARRGDVVLDGQMVGEVLRGSLRV